MSNLFSEEAKAQLTALKKQLTPQRIDSKDANSKPEEKVTLPSKANIQKQLKKLNQEKKQLEAQLTQKDNDQKHSQPAQATQDFSEITEDELLFKQAMAGIQPLKSKNQIRPENLRKTKAEKQNSQTLAKRAAALGNEETAEQPLSDMQALLNPVAEDAYLMYKQPTLPNHVFNKLKEGKFRWFEAVDIHGNSIEQAKEAVLKVIEITKQNQQSVLKIVHGKGKDAVLKTCVNGWLRQHDDVLAFTSAAAKDGGTGAVLVLLKRSA